MLALTFAVTYWDQLGWKDTFAKPAFTARQLDYARARGHGQIATPQTIVNGRGVTNGGDRKGLIQTIRQAERGASGPAIEAASGRVTVGVGRTARPATVWLVRYDSRTLDVPIRAGENNGKTSHTATWSVPFRGLAAGPGCARRCRLAGEQSCRPHRDPRSAGPRRSDRRGCQAAANDE